MFTINQHSVTTDFAAIKNQHQNIFHNFHYNCYNYLLRDYNLPTPFIILYDNSTKFKEQEDINNKLVENKDVEKLQQPKNQRKKKIKSKKSKSIDKKMPPITEKRSPSIIKGNVKENFPSPVVVVNSNTTTTGTSAVTLNSNGVGGTNNNSNKQFQQSLVQQQQQHPLSDKIDNHVPEIIDFRDSWLQEIEMYKDQIKAQQQQLMVLQQQQQQQQHQHHNHNHQHHHNAPEILNDLKVAATTTSAVDETMKTNGNNNKTLKNSETTRTTNLAAKRRTRTRSDSDSCGSSVCSGGSSSSSNSNGRHRRYSQESDDGLVLKRVRLDNSILSSYSTISSLQSSNNSNNNKNKLPRQFVDNNNRHSSKLIRNRKRKSPSPSSTATTITTTSASSLSSLESSPSPKMLTNNKQEQTATTPIKVITNVYHANLLINSQTQQLLEKHKPMAQIHNCNNGTILPFLQQQRLSCGFNNETTSTLNTVQNSSKNSAAESKCMKGNETNNTSKSPTTKIVNGTNGKRQEPSYMNSNDDELDDDEDEIFGQIDEVNLLEISDDDDDDEYIGYPYYLDIADEKRKLESKTNVTDYVTPKKPFSPSLFPNVPPFINFSSHIQKGPTLPNELLKVLKFKLTNVMPKIVRRVVSNSGFRLIKKTDDWIGTWEKHMKGPGFKMLRTHQKFNHLPGTFKIGRKDSVWRNLNQLMKKYGKKEFGFMPKTYILPQDIDDLKKAWPVYARKNTKWIIKPPASARGSGIKVINRWSQIPKSTAVIVQKYIERPLLIEGSKFDLRLYVLITSVNPLRIYLHTDGLARFASVQYSDKLDTLNDRCMHLTNYSINKLSSNYAKNDDINACTGHKWTLKSLWSYFEKRNINTKRLWATLRNLVIRTVISGEGYLSKMFKMNVESRYSCYELLGFDVILDENLIPWLLEVNISPSLHSDLILDEHIKGPLVQAVLNTSLFQVPPTLSQQLEKKILKSYNLKGPLCYDKRIFTGHLTPKETQKQNSFTNHLIEDREDYIDVILDDLTPADVRCLMITEDELARSSPLERIFPTAESHIYLNFLDGPRYYNRLLDAWETKYADRRSEGIELLTKYSKENYHLEVAPCVLRRKSEERIQELQQNENAVEVVNGDGTTIEKKEGNLAKSDSQLSINSTVVDDSASLDNDDSGLDCNSTLPTTNQQQQQQQSPQAVSCSKEAATANTTNKDTDNQLSNGPRAIVVETQ